MSGLAECPCPTTSTAGRLRTPALAAALLASLAFMALTGSANAAPGSTQFRDATARVVQGGDRAAARSPQSRSAPRRGDRRDIPLLTPDPAKLRRAKARAAEELSGAPGPSPRGISPLPKASVFGGLNKPGMASEGNSTPPDTTGAIGPGHYVEFVNGTGITAYDRNLDPVSGPVALEDFIGFPLDAVFDPQIQWDANWGRWIYVMDDIEGPEDNYLAFGWSKTADPTNLTTEFSGEGLGAGWCEYFIYTGEFFDDYPKLGHSNSGITIGTNVFAPGFVGSRLWSIAKPASPQTCPELGVGTIGATGALETEDGDPAFTPVPANTADSSANSYVVAADSPFFTADTEIMAWHISGAGAGAELFEDGNMGVGPFEFPANVPQEGTTEVLDSLDARLTNAVAITDPAVGEEAVWTQHTIDGPGGRSVVRWYELLPDSQTVRQEGTISDPSHFVFNGAISPSTQGNSAAINFNRGSATLFPEMHARSREGTTPLGQMVGDVLLGTSAGIAQDFSCEAPEPCRWGDYAGASPDPVIPGVVWGSNQGLAAPSGVFARWTTRNFALVADGTPPAPPAISGTDPASPANDNFPRVKGSAEEGSTVRLYRSGDCSGTVAALGPAAVFGATGIGVPVPDNSTTQFTATATDAVGNVSPCSNSISYSEDSTPPSPPGGESAGDGGPPPRPGTLSVRSGIALVRNGKAAVPVECPRGGPCSGLLKFVVRVIPPKAKRSSATSSKRRRKARNVVIGKAPFSIAAGARKTIRVPLSKLGKALVRKAGRRGLPVKVAGKGVARRTLTLKQAGRKRR